MRPHILQVDDVQANRLVVEKALAGLDPALSSAANGGEALDLLAKHRFDLLVLDVHLPDITGFEIARRLRAAANGPNHETPILFISAGQQALEDMLTGFELGAVDYLLRPVPTAILRSKVAALCALQRAKRRVAEQRDEIARQNLALEAALTAREESEQRYRALLAHSPGGILVEVDGEVVFHNRAALDLLGYGPTERVGPRALLDIAGADHRAALAGHLDRARRGEAAGEFLECGLSRRDGSAAFVELQAAPVPFGSRTGLQVVLQDLGARRRAQEALLRVQAAIEGARDGVVITDADGLPIYINIAFGNLFGYTLETFRTVGVEAIHADPTQGLEMIQRVLQAEEFDEEAELIARRGERITALARGSVVLDDSYRIIGATLVYTDITERKRLEEELRAMSRQDALTGVPNRRTFDEHLAGDWARARRHRTPIAVALIDIDAFKAYNDARGHQQGDECLRTVAQALAGICKRPGELMARYGGEEFAAILPSTNEEEAARAAETMRDAVASLALPHGNSINGPTVTVSVGVASMVPDRKRGSETLVRMADQALYRAKAGGRNRVVRASTPEG